MDRAALDAWFADAGDVLTDWQPSGDAMIARVPETDDVEAMWGDSYYDQDDCLDNGNVLFASIRTPTQDRTTVHIQGADGQWREMTGNVAWLEPAILTEADRDHPAYDVAQWVISLGFGLDGQQTEMLRAVF